MGMVVGGKGAVSRGPALRRKKTDPKIDLDIAAMEAKLAQANAKLDELRRKPTSPRVEADIKAAEASVARFSHQLDELNRKKHDPKIDLDIANASAKLAGLRAKLSNLNESCNPKLLDAREAIRRGEGVEDEVAAVQPAFTKYITIISPNHPSATKPKSRADQGEHDQRLRLRVV